MKQLIIPNRSHEYVIGIDFGHGETSAALCKLDWDATDPGFNYIDLDLASNSKVIVSAICKTADGSYYIGEKSFSPNVITNQSALSVCFKAEPQDINGENERLMIEYMRVVYNTITQNKADLLTQDNHVVYIARPSGWHSEQTKRLYEQMALTAGIPLAGLTSESRAAFFYAKNDQNIGFQKVVDEGAIVVDLGSSTLDLTYMRQDEEAIDHGYPHGASAIEKAIYEDQIVADDEMRAFTEKYPKLRDALLYEARKIKEKAYKEPELPIRKKISIEDIYEDDPDFIDAVCRIKYTPIESNGTDESRSINDVIEQRWQYISQLYQDMADFRDRYISGKPVHGVFMTGGASRMGFVAEKIMRAYGLTKEQVKRDDDPSLTISRGIALLGKADAVSNQLSKAIFSRKESLISAIQTTNFAAILAEQITNDVWNYVVAAFNEFRDSTSNLSFNDLIDMIDDYMNQYISRELQNRISECIDLSICKHIESVKEQVEKIINYYAPGKKLELPLFKYDVSDIDLVGEGLSEKIAHSISSVMATIASSMNNMIGQALWAALGFFLFGLFSVAYYAVKWLMSANETEEEKNEKMKNKPLDANTRQKVYNKIADDQDEIRSQIGNDIYTQLSYCDLNTYFSELCRNYINEYVDKTINSVKIAIE